MSDINNSLPTIKARKDALSEGQSYAALVKGKPFSRVTFKLDTKTSKDANNGNRFSLPFVGFYVEETNDVNFNVNIYLNGDNNVGDYLKLSPEMNPDFSGAVFSGASLEWTAQAGKYITILFFHEFPIKFGTLKASQTNTTYISEGTSHDSVKVTMALNTTTELIPANSGRGVAHLQLKAGGAFWIGTPTELANGDYKNICQKITLSIDGEPFKWINSGALHAKTDVLACTFSRFTENK